MLATELLRAGYGVVPSPRLAAGTRLLAQTAAVRKTKKRAKCALLLFSKPALQKVVSHLTKTDLRTGQCRPQRDSVASAALPPTTCRIAINSYKHVVESSVEISNQYAIAPRNNYSLIIVIGIIV